MSKKTNTLLFVLGATVFNILTTVIFFLLLLFAYTGIMGLLGPDKQAAAAPWGAPVVFLGAIVLSFLFYRFVLNKVTKKYKMEDHFDPLFGRKRPPKKPAD